MKVMQYPVTRALPSVLPKVSARAFLSFYPSTQMEMPVLVALMPI